VTAYLDPRFETESRLGRGAGDAHYEIGWHVTGTVGHVGTAAAAGRVLELTPATLVQALGTAGSLTHPAIDAVLSLRAEHRFTSPTWPLCGRPQIPRPRR
jgi:hypothetical protein